MARSIPFLLPSSLFPVVLLFLASCANPVPPSGGPRDTTPPRVVQSAPENGEVNVDRASIHLVFSEYVDRSSFEQSIAVTPAFDGRLDVSFGGDEATIRFPEPLRENTTYILTLDKTLQDARNVNLDAPITIAFSTGPTINRGALEGRVVAATTGEGEEGVDIYAYGHPDLDTPTGPPPLVPIDSLPERPDYRTQTDSEGQFQFEYLQEQPYFVVALADNNRNRQPDPLEAYAVPPRPWIIADSAATDAANGADWILTQRDTIPPTAVRLRSLSQRRHELRFDEPVRVADRTPGRWTLQDSLRDRSMRVASIYQRAESPNLVFLHTEALEASPHRLFLPDSAVVDSSGTPARPDTLRFTPSETPDTLQTRFTGFMPENLMPDTAGVYTLFPGEAPGVRFNQPLDSTRLHAAVTARDTAAGADRSFTPTTRDGTTYRLRFAPPLRPEDEVQVRVDGGSLAHADTVFARTFRRISNRQLGELSGTVTFADTTAHDDGTRPPFVVELYTDDNALARITPRRTRADADGQFLFEQLPEGPFRFRAFLDTNGNGRWDGGQLLPYRPAEPLTWSDGTMNTRPRWESVLETPLRISNP